MKRYLFLITAVLAALFLLASCGCAEHLDKNGDARCDVCLQRLPEATAPAVTTAAPGTTHAPNASLPEDRELAERLSAALAEAYLGARLDIGLTAESAPYYRLEGEEGYVRLNADGTLEIIGVRARNTLLTLKTYDGRTVYQGFYCPGQRPLSVALRRALSSEGLIASEAADAPDTAIGALSALSLSGTPLTDVRELSAIRYMRSLSTLDHEWSSFRGLANGLWPLIMHNGPQRGYLEQNQLFFFNPLTRSSHFKGALHPGFT